MTERPTIMWFRRDLRLSDNPALAEAAHGGAPVIPLYGLDETEALRAPGAAGLWWLDRSLRALGEALEDKGSRLILRRGEAAKIIEALAKETDAAKVSWNRLPLPGWSERDDKLQKTLETAGVEVETFNASLLIEPGTVRTKTGGLYQVFTPFWNAARKEAGDFELKRAPAHLKPPAHWPKSDALGSWRLHPEKPDWSKGFDVWTPGEGGAHARLHRFVDDSLQTYPHDRDRPAVEGSSRLSPHLHWGEIGPRQVWRAVEAAAHRRHGLHAQAEKFFAELGWREFNYGLLAERPDLPTHNFHAAFDAFPWRDAQAALGHWQKGETGYPIVDAGMRQLWQEGWMHNRVRLITASFLVKHLLVDWREGERWFWDCLVDADEANNVLNWQWIAGSGADAQPFFRIFAPVGQSQKFDPDGAYIRRWIPELAKLPAKAIHAPWEADEATLKAADVALGKDYPRPIVDHKEARERALGALREMRSSNQI